MSDSMMSVRLKDKGRTHLFPCVRLRVTHNSVRFRIKDKVMSRVFDLAPEVEFEVIYEKSMRIRITTQTGDKNVHRDITKIHWNPYPKEIPVVVLGSDFKDFSEIIDIPDIKSLWATRGNVIPVIPRSPRGYFRSSG